MEAVWVGHVIALKADPKVRTALHLLGLSASAELRAKGRLLTGQTHGR